MSYNHSEQTFILGGSVAKNIKWMCLRFTIVLVSIMVVGCSTYGKISALPADYQELIHKDDRKILTSEKYNRVGLSPKSEKIRNKGWGDFMLIIENRSSNNMEFSISDISARSYDLSVDETMDLEVFRREELIRKAKSSQKTSNTWDSLGSFIYALDAAVSAGGNSASTSLERQKKHEERRAKSKKRHEETLRGMELLMPDTAMILPGEKMDSFIRVQLPKITDTSKKIIFSINLDDEEHQLAFIQEKINNEERKTNSNN